MDRLKIDRCLLYSTVRQSALYRRYLFTFSKNRFALYKLNMGFLPHFLNYIEAISHDSICISPISYAFQLLSSYHLKSLCVFHKEEKNNVYIGLTVLNYRLFYRIISAERLFCPETQFRTLLPSNLISFLEDIKRGTL